MYNDTLDEVSASVQQIVCNQQELLRYQHEANADIHTQPCLHAHFSDTLTE